LAPVLKNVEGIKKFYVIPDGLLHHVPFDALIANKPTKESFNFRNLEYLIKDYTFSYGYSATTLFQDQSYFTKKTESRENILAFAPSYSGSNPSAGQPFGVIRSNLKDLKWNSKEVDGIKDKFDGKYLLDAQASKMNFKENYEKYNILHLAMHAIVNEEEPMYSHLAFTQNSDTEENAFLHAFEIFQMNFNAEMVVLSACNTGYGKLFTGEGAMSLAKAFSYAGCESVVMSYWPADDQASGQIMNRFYKYLADGINKDEALRKAKLDFFENADQQMVAPAL